MFHAKDGLYFERGGDGSVIVTVKVDGAENSPTIRTISLDQDTWVSVLTAMRLPDAEPKRSRAKKPNDQN